MSIKNNDYIFFWLCILSGLLAGNIHTLKGQSLPEIITYDTILVKSGNKLTYSNTAYKFKKDTSILLPKGSDYKIKPDKKEEFIKKLDEKTQENIFTRELRNIIVIKPSNSAKRDTFKTQISAEPYYKYVNKTIRKIIIKQLPVFGPTIEDTSLTTISVLEKTANRFHFQTKRFLVQRHLFFKENQLINPDILADNERILRSIPYFDDAKIEVKNYNNESDSVDILVIVKDNWSKAFDLETDNFNSGRFDVMNKNIFGFGQEVQNSFMWDDTKKPGAGYEGIYKTPNILGTFFRGVFLYNKSFGSQTLSININRDFFTPNIKYAGGLVFQNIQSDIRYFSNQPPEDFPIEYNHYELWTGRSYYLNHKSLTKFRSNITFSGKLITDKYYKRPVISEVSYYELQNKTLFLFNLAYTKQNYFKSSQIYNFGRTEDIPVGAEIGVTAGYEFNEFTNRNYIGGSLGYGLFAGRVGYLQVKIQGGGFLNNSIFEQGIVTTNFNYFTNLFVINRYNFRQFLSVNYVKGFKRFQREYLTINDRNGILGFTNDSIYGNERFNMKWETDCFTPWNLFDFHFVLFIYADHSWLAKTNEVLFDNLPYTGVGFGIRLRNDRLVFNTIQLRFTFFPNIPTNSRSNFFKASGEPLYRPNDFSPKPPSLLNFK